MDRQPYHTSGSLATVLMDVSCVGSEYPLPQNDLAPTHALGVECLKGRASPVSVEPLLPGPSEVYRGVDMPLRSARLGLIEETL